MIQYVSLSNILNTRCAKSSRVCDVGLNPLPHFPRCIAVILEVNPHSARATFWQREHETTASQNIALISFVDRHPRRPGPEQIRQSQVRLHICKTICVVSLIDKEERIWEQKYCVNTYSLPMHVREPFEKG